MDAYFLALIVLVIAYLSGSVCSAIIVSRIFDLPNPQTKGSENPGATNVLRLAGKKYALIVFVVDMLKGMLPVLLAKVLGFSATFISFTCLFAVLGHLFPVFFHFKGGKGVATTIGALLGFHFSLGLMLMATWAVVAKYSKYSSLASLISIGLAPLFTILFIESFDPFPAIFFITLFVFYKHRENITRLTDGTEPKMFKK